MPRLRDIDIGLLRAFIAVAETGRMTTAAKIVNLSQGAVSQQIKRLEQLFDGPLFERRADAARLTRAGERLMGAAYRMVALNDEVVNLMRRSDFSGEVRLGVPHDIVGILLPPILRSFRQAHPSVLVTLVSDTTSTLRSALRNGSVDLALMTESERGSRGQWLLSDRLVWVGANGGEAWLRRPLSVALGQESCGFRASASMPWTRRASNGGPSARSAVLNLCSPRWRLTWLLRLSCRGQSLNDWRHSTMTRFPRCQASISTSGFPVAGRPSSQRNLPSMSAKAFAEGTPELVAAYRWRRPKLCSHASDTKHSTNPPPSPA